MTPAAMLVAEAAPGTTAKLATQRLKTKKCNGSGFFFGGFRFVFRFVRSCGVMRARVEGEWLWMFDYRSVAGAVGGGSGGEIFPNEQNDFKKPVGE